MTRLGIEPLFSRAISEHSTQEANGPVYMISYYQQFVLDFGTYCLTYFNKNDRIHLDNFKKSKTKAKQQLKTKQK